MRRGRRSTPPELGAHNAEVKRLRALLRDRATRHADRRFVVEGPRTVTVAMQYAAADIDAVYVGADATASAHLVAEHAGALGLDIHTLASGVAARVSETRHTQGLFAIARMRATGLQALHADGRVLVVACEALADPGNLGTLLRSAGAAGAAGVILGAGSVDAYNPKVVRASAGACFAIRIVEDVPLVQALESFAGDWQRIGAAAAGGQPPESFDFRRRTVLVLGHETRGLSADVDTVLDGHVTIPMQGESLNVAMAGTVLLFEAARQQRVGR